jgi:hypothetical protein
MRSGGSRAVLGWVLLGLAILLMALVLLVSHSSVLFVGIIPIPFILIGRSRVSALLVGILVAALLAFLVLATL